MPNWNETTYRVTGDKEKCADLYKKIKSLENMKESLRPNGFGKLWCGNLVHLLGGDETDAENLYCRGHIIDFKLLEDGDLIINVESAWGELNQFRHFIEEKIKGIKIYHISEEPGMEIFITNDEEGKYFPERFYLDICDEENDVYETEYPESLDRAKEILSEKFPDRNFNFDTYEEIKNTIADMCEEHEDICVVFEPFKFVDN